MFRALHDHHQEAELYWCSIWYRHSQSVAVRCTIARNMLSWLELLISRYCCMYLVVCIIYINDARSSKYQIMKYICWLNI